MILQHFKREHAHEADRYGMALPDKERLQKTTIRRHINLLWIRTHEYFVRLFELVALNIQFRDDVEARIIVHMICKIRGSMLYPFLNSIVVKLNIM